MRVQMLAALHSRQGRMHKLTHLQVLHTTLVFVLAAAGMMMLGMVMDCLARLLHHVLYTCITTHIAAIMHG